MSESQEKTECLPPVMVSDSCIHPPDPLLLRLRKRGLAQEKLQGAFRLYDDKYAWLNQCVAETPMLNKHRKVKNELRFDEKSH